MFILSAVFTTCLGINNSLKTYSVRYFCYFYRFSLQSLWNSSRCLNEVSKVCCCVFSLTLLKSSWPLQGRWCWNCRHTCPDCSPAYWTCCCSPVHLLTCSPVGVTTAVSRTAQFQLPVVKNWYLYFSSFVSLLHINRKLCSKQQLSAAPAAFIRGSKVLRLRVLLTSLVL